MRDDNERTAACIELPQYGGDQSFSACGIQPRRRFIEEEQRGIGGKCERREKATALSAREPCGIRSQRFVQPRRKCPYHIGKLRRLQCIPHPLLIHILMQTQKIVACRCAEEIAPLQGSYKEGA